MLAKIATTKTRASTLILDKIATGYAAEMESPMTLDFQTFDKASFLAA